MYPNVSMTKSITRVVQVIHQAELTSKLLLIALEI